MAQIFQIVKDSDNWVLITESLKFKLAESKKTLTMLKADSQVEPELRYSGIIDDGQLAEIFDQGLMEVELTEALLKELEDEKSEEQGPVTFG